VYLLSTVANEKRIAEMMFTALKRERKSIHVSNAMEVSEKKCVRGVMRVPRRA